MITPNFARAAVRPLFAASLVGLMALLVAAPGMCASTDIVASNGTIRDALANIAADGGLPIDASQLLDFRLLTRADAALLLEKGLGLSGATTPQLKSEGEVAALRSALIQLRPELLADHVDVDALLKKLSDHTASYMADLEPELRIDTGNSKNSPGSGLDGIYRGTVLGDIDSKFQYGVSVSDQAEENERVFTNDVGPHDYSALSQAYINFNGDRGLNVLIGRTDDNWGAAAEGGALLSDNAAPLDQIRVNFPFSLGRRLGRNWNYTQLAGTYEEDGQRKYLQGRRVEINFSSHWSAQYEEALKSTSSSLLDRAPLPFLIGKGIDLNSIESESEFIANLGLQYAANRNFRTYGQLLINDIKSPFRGNFAGFDVGNGGTTPQRLAYVVGAGYNSQHGTNASLEFSTADPTTYQDSQPSLAWTRGAYNYLGLPDGPNFKQVYGMISQSIAPKVTVYVEGRYRTRFSNSYPAPDSEDTAVSAKYQLDRRNSVSLTYHDYFQDAYPYAPGSPNYPTNAYTPPSEGYAGTDMTIHELDAGYQLVF